VSNKDPAGRVTVRAVCYRSMRKHEKPQSRPQSRVEKNVLNQFKSDFGVILWRLAPEVKSQLLLAGAGAAAYHRNAVV